MQLEVFFIVVLASVAVQGAENEAWPRGCVRQCGSLMTPGVSFGNRADETDHCFPGSNSDHMVCCVNIQNSGNSHNPSGNFATHNPLEGPITRNSMDPNNLSWCTCSEAICTDQLNGTVAWNGC